MRLVLKPLGRISNASFQDIVSEHCAVLAGIHARERVTLVELRAPVDDLPGFTGWAGAARVPLGDRVEDAPLPQSLERVVVRERTLDPELDEAARGGIDPASARMFPPRPAGPGVLNQAATYG